MMDLLEVKDLRIWLKQSDHYLKAVNGVKFSIKKGETFALVGESGCGKTMTANAIMRLLPYQAQFVQGSSINFLGNELLNYSEIQMRKLRRSDIAMIFQEPMTALNPVLSIQTELIESINESLSKKDKINKAIELLELVKLQRIKEILRSYPHQLSGGQKQRIIIAMALAREVKLIIADEPTTALDVTVQKEILYLLKSLQQSYGLSLLFISHNLAVVKEISDSLAVMKNGVFVEQAETERFFNDPKENYSINLLNAMPKAQFKQDEKAGENKQNHILKVNQLNVFFKEKTNIFSKNKYFHALKEINFSLNQGETLAIVGESGSGKTTLARALLNIISYQGDIYFKNQLISKFSKKNQKELKQKLHIIFQDPFSSMNPKLLIESILSEGLIAHRLYKNKAKRRVFLIKLLESVGLLENALDRYPHEFSGGQRQRIAIARALSLSPEVIICDEPSSALDVSVQAKVLKLLKDLQVKRKLSYKRLDKCYPVF